MLEVLVVDDEKRIADTAALILRAKGYSAQATYDATSALRLCRDHLPDLLISDVVLPGISGVELAMTIRQEFSTCEVLLFSGQAATAGMIEKARVLGHEFELLAKPVHPEVLLQKVAERLRPKRL